MMTFVAEITSAEKKVPDAPVVPIQGDAAGKTKKHKKPKRKDGKQKFVLCCEHVDVLQHVTVLDDYLWV